MGKKIKELSIYGGTSLGWLEDAEEVEKEEQLAIQAKAKEYAEWRTEQLPDFIKSNLVRDALYCAYLEGAGIRTK